MHPCAPGYRRSSGIGMPHTGSGNRIFEKTIVFVGERACVGSRFRKMLTYGLGWNNGEL